MLRQRVITALVLVLLLACAVMLLPASGFQLFVAAVCLIAAWEWTALAGISQLAAKAGYVLATGVLMAALAAAPQIQVWFLWASLLWWAIALYFVLHYPDKSQQWSATFTMLTIGACILLPAWCALLLLRAHPDFQFLFWVMVLLITSADIGAYFCGKTFGKSKLAVRVSPNKTWEGFWGGVGLSTAFGFLVGLALYLQALLDSVGHLLLIVVACFLMAMMGVLGDLFESMCKRQRGIKDSGSILPGHGGMLDRIDSFTAVVPAFMLLILLLELF